MWFHFWSLEWISPFMAYRRTTNHDPNQYLLNNSITAGRPLFSCDQGALWMVQSVCLSIRLSAHPSVIPSSLCSHHYIFMKVSGVVTMPKVMSMQKVKVGGQRSRSNPIYPSPDCLNSHMVMKSCTKLMFFKVIRQISRYGTKNRCLWPKLSVTGL